MRIRGIAPMSYALDVGPGAFSVAGTPRPTATTSDNCQSPYKSSPRVRLWALAVYGPMPPPTLTGPSHAIRRPIVGLPRTGSPARAGELAQTPKLVAATKCPARRSTAARLRVGAETPASVGVIRCKEGMARTRV